MDGKLRTTSTGKVPVYAAGDCTGDRQFTHYAGFQGALPCGRHARCGVAWVPARPRRLIGRGWPRLGVAPGTLWGWRSLLGCHSSRVVVRRVLSVGAIAARNALLPLSDTGTLASVPGCTFTAPEVASAQSTNSEISLMLPK